MLTNVQQINAEAKVVYEEKFCPIFKKHLGLNGFTPEIIDIVKEHIDQSCLSPVGDEPSGDPVIDEVRTTLSAATTEAVNSLEETARLEGEIVVVDALQQETDILASIEADSYIVQNAKISLSRREQIASEPKVTSPIDIQNADYTIREDYPNTYGFVDSVKNWFKINKEKGHAEFVHQSGSYFKIDNDGNVSFYITGSMKQIVEGDMTFEVRKNMDTLVKKNNYKHVVKNNEELTGGTLLETVVGKVTNIFKATLTEKVSGNVTENYGASHTTSISGSKTETAASINHN